MEEEDKRSQEHELPLFFEQPAQSEGCNRERESLEELDLSSSNLPRQLIGKRPTRLQKRRTVHLPFCSFKQATRDKVSRRAKGKGVQNCAHDSASGPQSADTTSDSWSQPDASQDFLEAAIGPSASNGRKTRRGLQKKRYSASSLDNYESGLLVFEGSAKIVLDIIPKGVT